MLHFDTIKFTLCRKTQVQDNLDEDCSFTVKTFEYGNVRISTQHVSEKITMGSISHAFLPNNPISSLLEHCIVDSVACLNRDRI